VDPDAAKGPRTGGADVIAPGTHPNLRPKNAATLIVIRRAADGFRVLMGRRSDAHVFMPGLVVFPGGRVDRGDHQAPFRGDLHPEVMAKITASGMKPSLARALALASIRETFEETGILIGASAPQETRCTPSWRPFLANGVIPDLSPLRLVARAITPPRRPRRFDARFFAVFDTEIAAEVAVPDDELKAPAWLSFADTEAQQLPHITRLVLDQLRERLEKDRDLHPDAPTPFYSFRHGRRHFEMI
jgi:8-oxo-dGTP pyrophosphatase MutT (NUDIX family)